MKCRATISARSGFAPQVKRRLEQKYPGYEFVAYGDPKGRDKTQTDERTAYDVFGAHGIPMQAAPVKQNLIDTRIEAVEYLLGQLYDGRPRLQISPNCRTLIAACEGGYCYDRKMRSAELKTEPAKNCFSHLADCLQYLAISMGEGRSMMGLDAHERIAGDADLQAARLTCEGSRHEQQHRNTRSSRVRTR